MTKPAEDIKTIARNYLEAIDREDWDRIRESLAPEVLAQIDGQTLDRNALIAKMRVFSAGFSRGLHEIGDLIAEGDRVVARGAWKGIHTGTFKGLSATGRSVAVFFTITLRISEGRIVAERDDFDVHGLMHRITRNRSRMGSLLGLGLLGLLSFNWTWPFWHGGTAAVWSPRTADIVLATIALFFATGVAEKIGEISLSKDGVSAKFQSLENKVDQQREEAEKIRDEQLEMLKEQQSKLEELQAFMYGLLLGEKDVDRITQLKAHIEAKTGYSFRVSESVGMELRRLRDLGLVAVVAPCRGVTDILNASDKGTKEIDLTKFLTVTTRGEKFLAKRPELVLRDVDGSMASLMGRK